MSVTPAMNGRTIGLAHYATRAVLERVLAGSGTTFHQSVALGATGDTGGTTERAALTHRLTSTLKVDARTAEATVDELIAAGLLAEPPGAGGRLGLTAEGRALREDIRAGTARITALLYADLTPEDLATAGRVLTTVTERADAVLAKG